MIEFPIIEIQCNSNCAITQPPGSKVPLPTRLMVWYTFERCFPVKTSGDLGYSISRILYNNLNIRSLLPFVFSDTSTPPEYPRFTTIHFFGYFHGKSVAGNWDYGISRILYDSLNIRIFQLFNFSDTSTLPEYPKFTILFIFGHLNALSDCRGNDSALFQMQQGL